MTAAAAAFPPELVDWVPYAGNPLFAGTGGETWDREIRERGFVRREGKDWRLWYTGYDSRRGETKAARLRHLARRAALDAAPAQPRLRRQPGPRTCSW